MTMLGFELLCGEYLIPPEIAMENKNLIAALLAGDETEARRILAAEF